MRYVPVVRATYGVSLLLLPGAMVRVVSGKPADRVSTVVGRILGARHLLQALTIERKGTRGWLLVGVTIDAIHTLSMLGLAALSRDRRRMAALDATLAGGLALNELREVRNA
jgi:hypothetical protein